MAPSSRFALSLKPSVAYLDLNFPALWKKQTTLPSLAYAGIPYQVLGASSGALVVMRAWSRSAMARSGSAISAIFASTSLSPSPEPRRSLARSFIAGRSSAVNALRGFRSAIARLVRIGRVAVVQHELVAVGVGEDRHVADAGVEGGAEEGHALGLERRA